MNKCEQCCELANAPILVNLVAEKMKKDVSKVLTAYHKNNHNLFGKG